MTIQVKLPPALEKFAEDCVAEGRYENIDAVVRSGLDLLQRQDAWRRDLANSLQDSMQEAERDGYFTIDQVVAEMNAVIDEVAAEKATTAD
jgi:antitoxin ParD1/3/4